MNDEDPSSSSSQTTLPTRSGAEGTAGREATSEERGESWLERLKAAIGFKGSASSRQELEEALAREDITGDTFTPEERLMLRNILRLRDVRVEDVMVPRADIDAVEVGVSLGELVRAFRESGHSRMPVYRGTLDDPIGMVHIKDVMASMAGGATVDPNGNGRQSHTADLDLRRIDLSQPLAELDLVRSVLFVPPSMPAVALLANMQVSRMQLALVIDEYGGTDGVVSLEDVVETVVGDIEDEHDTDEQPMIVPDSTGGFLVDARADLEEVAEAVGVGLAASEESEDVDTIGGLLFSLLGRIPVRGELVSLNSHFEIEILDADPRRLKRLRITRRTDGAASDQDKDAAGARATRP